MERTETPPAPIEPRSAWREILSVLRGNYGDYTTGSLRRAVVFLAVPMVLEMVMESLFSIVDIYFIGELGSNAVAAAGLTMSWITIIFAVALGLSMGTTATVARRIGEGNPEAARRAAAQAIGLGVLISIPLGILGAVFAGDLLRLLGGEAETVRVGTGFTAIMLGGNITIFLIFLINAVFRGAGDAFLAMRALWLANGINIILDPLLIKGIWIFPELGMEGAAIATTIGRGVGVGYQIWMLARGSGRIHTGLRHFRPVWEEMVRLLNVSAFGIVQILIGTASWMAMMKILARFGDEVLAGYTIAIRIVIFILLPAWGIANAAATLMGQNLGAQKPERAEAAVWLTAKANAIFLVGVSVSFFLFAEEMCGIFSKDANVIRVGATSLRWISASYLFLAYGLTIVQAFNGAGDTRTPTFLNLLAYWIVQIPLAWFLSTQTGLAETGAFIAIAIAQTVLAISAIWAFRKGLWLQHVV
ncbi:MAG: MATE family efflux transporter [Planctomycetota bacterium]